MQTRAITLASGIALALAGAIAFASGDSVADDAVASTDVPARMVVAGGAVTETLYALGLGGRIIAADTTSMFPEAAMNLPKVGYLRQLSAEGVLAMRPDHILLGQGAGPAAAVEQIKSSGLPVSDISSGWTPDSVARMVRDIGNAVGSPDAADALATEIDTDFATLAESLPDEERPSVLLIMSAGTGPLLGAGTNTAAQSVIELAGGRLALPDLVGYRPLSLEPVLAANPDYLLVPRHVLDALGGEEALASLDLVSKTPAGREGRIIVMDSLYLLGFGPRAPEAAADLASVLHPDADIPLLDRAASPSPLIALVN